LGLRQGGGKVVPYDDGCGMSDRTAHRRTRSDTGFETAHDEGTNLGGRFSLTGRIVCIRNGDNYVLEPEKWFCSWGNPLICHALTCVDCWAGPLSPFALDVLVHINRQQLGKRIRPTQ